jgi:hypothetical protein
VIHRRPFAQQHPILLGLAILFGVAFVITYWSVFVAARADYEHWLLMRGDEWLGTFGQYRPRRGGGPNDRAASGVVAVSSIRMTRRHRKTPEYLFATPNT